MQSQNQGQEDGWDSLVDLNDWDFDEGDNNIGNNIGNNIANNPIQNPINVIQINRNENMVTNNNQITNNNTRNNIGATSNNASISNNQVIPNNLVIPNNSVVRVANDDDWVKIPSNSQTKSTNLIYIVSTVFGILSIFAIIVKLIRFLSEMNIVFLVFITYFCIDFGFKKTLELINDIVDDTIYEVIDAISPRNIVNRAISGFFVTNNA